MSRTGAALVALAGAMLATPASGAQVRFENFDKNHSTIGFVVPILGGLSEVEGKFTAFTITLVYDESDLAKSSVEAVIETASVDTGIADRDEHLRSADFFAVAQYPEMRFASRRIEARGDKWVAIGDFELRGVKRTVELGFEIKGVRSVGESGDLVIGIAADAELDRQDYGVAWRHPDPLFVGDTIQVDIHLISKLTPRPPP